MPKISDLISASAVNPSDLFVFVDMASVPTTKKVSARTLSAIAPVQSVAGKIGAVLLTAGDVSGFAAVATSGSASDLSTGTLPIARLPAATTTTLGAVSIGSGLSVSSGAVSANVQSVAGKTGAVLLTASDVGLGSVDNTADASKPVSSAQALANTAVQNYSVQRANHTGTQTVSTINDFATESAKYGPVASVAGKTGTVLLAAGDVTGLAAVATSGSASDLSTGTLASARLPLATTSTLGAVSVGTGLSVTAGAVSANVQSVAGKTGAVTLALTDVSGADNIVFSKISGITGATAIANIVTLSQAQYDALLTPDSATLYVIRGA
jgi:hypothetical protein